MQSLFQKVSKRVANVVGGSGTGELGDEILQECKQRLDELEQQVTSVRSQFATYAEQMMQSSEASVLLSRSVADFYRSANNSARSESVKLYEEVQDNAANNAVAIYQRQLRSEDGVISELDQWLQIVARVNEQIEEADRLRQAAETASSRLQTLQNKVDSRKPGGSIFGQDGTDLQNRMEETERAQKNFEADFESARNEVRENVARIMQKRFTMFDRVYVQILECQVQFFERSAKDVDGFRRSIRNYRRKFPRDSGSTMHSSLSHGISRTTSEPRDNNKRDSDHSPPKPQRNMRNASAPMEANGPTSNGAQISRGETDFLGGFMDMSGNGDANDDNSNAGIDNSGADSHDSGDMFGEYQTAPASSHLQSTSAPVEMEEQKSQQQQQRPPGPKRQVSDMFGLNLFGTTPHGHSDTELDYPAHPQQLNSGNKRASRSSVDLGAMHPKHKGPTASEMFDDDFWATNTPTASSAPVGGANLMGEFEMGGPATTTVNTQPPATTDEKYELPHLMEEGPASAAGRGAGVLNMSGAAERREFVRKLQEEEKINHENREQAQDAVEARLRSWEYKGDVRRNLRSLLTSMDRVLWEGAKWKPLQMSELLNHEKIAKKYKKALNSVHPDKISLVRGFSPEQIAIAEGVFMALTEAWLEYEKSQR